MPFQSKSQKAISYQLTGITAMLAVLGINGVMAVPLLGPISIFLAVAGIWWWIPSQSERVIKALTTPTGIVFSCVFGGLLLLPWLSGAAVAATPEIISHGFNSPGPGVDVLWQGIIKAIDTVLSATPLTVYVHYPAEIPLKIAQVFEYSKSCFWHPVIWSAGIIGSMGMAVGNKASTDAIFGLISRTLFQKRERKYGISHAPGQTRPTSGYTEIFSLHHEGELGALLEKVGLPNLGKLLRFEISDELKERSNLVYAPIHSHVIQIKVKALRMTLKWLQGKEKGEELSAEDNSIKETLEHILRNIAVDADDEANYHMPRIMITDLPEEDAQERITETLHDLNPKQLKEALILEGEDWDGLFDEIIDDGLKQQIIQMMNETIQNTESLPASFNEGRNYTVDGAVHEVVHFLAGHLTREREIELFEIFSKMRNSRLYSKNMTKCLRGIKRYRKENSEEYPDPHYDTMALSMYMFTNEMFCDFFSIFIKEKADEKHIYQRYGEEIPGDLRIIFDEIWPGFLELDRQLKILLFSDEQEETSNMIEAQKIMAALGIGILRKEFIGVKPFNLREIIETFTNIIGKSKPETRNSKEEGDSLNLFAKEIKVRGRRSKRTHFESDDVKDFDSQAAASNVITDQLPTQVDTLDSGKQEDTTTFDEQLTGQEGLQSPQPTSPNQQTIREDNNWCSGLKTDLAPGSTPASQKTSPAVDLPPDLAQAQAFQRAADLLNRAKNMLTASPDLVSITLYIFGDAGLAAATKALAGSGLAGPITNSTNQSSGFKDDAD